MPTSEQDVRTALGAIEPDYPALARALGPDALPALDALVRGADAHLAAKAVYLASLLADPRAAAVVRAGAARAEPQVRVASAAASRNLAPAEAGAALAPLLDDPDAGIRKVALRAIPVVVPPALRARLEAIGVRDPEPALRELSRAALQRVRPGP